jgi:hypothetical protein
MKALLRTIAALGIAVISLPVTRAAGQETVIEYRCGVDGPGKPTTADGDDPIVKVLTLAASEPLRLPDGADPEKHFVACARSLLVPSHNDVKVLQAGFKLFIGAPELGSDELRMAILVGSKPDVVLIIVRGKATRSEARITEKVLKAINGR